MPQITDFFKGEDLVERYSSGKDFDIVFLDIEMDKMNGIDTATEMRKYAPEAIIIFVSSHKNYVFDAFRCEAFHFLVKPIANTRTNTSTNLDTNIASENKSNGQISMKI